MSEPHPDPAPTAARLPVLMYHRVGPIRDKWEQRVCVEGQRFRQHMLALRDAGYRAISLAECQRWLTDGGALPQGAVLITFDDGYQGVLDHAAPALANLGWSATMFLVTALMGGGDDWCRAEHPRGYGFPLLSWDQARALQAQGWEFGSHSAHHADLPTLSADALVEELTASRQILERELATPVAALAYPYGRFNDAVASASQQAGYRLGFTTQPGFNRPDADPLRLRRIDVLGSDSATMLRRKLALGTNDGSALNAGRYLLRRLAARFGR